MPHRKKKILIIEDDTILRENTAETLELANYEAITAVNGREGIAKVRSEKPDLILCDIIMPELDGYSVIQILSADPATSGIPFIFLSAKSEKEDVRKGMALGADDYLTKPLDESDMLSAIEGLLKRIVLLKRPVISTSEDLGEYMDHISELSAIKELYKDRNPRQLKRKEIIFKEGDEAHYLYFVCKGKLKMYKTHPDGKEYTTELLDVGDFFGFLAIMENRTYTENAEAIEDSVICRIPREDFDQLVRKDRDVAHAFIKLITRELYEKEKKMLSLAYDTVRKRTADALLELLTKFGKEGSGKNFVMNVPRSDIASMVGTAVESVIRTLSDFKEEKLIKITGKAIEILDEDGLKNIW